MSDRNEYKKMVVDSLAEKFWAQQQEQKEAARQLEKASLTTEQELSGEISLKCEEESLDDWF